MYLANNYVKIGGQILKRGDMIPDGTPKETIQWLLEKDAIRETAPIDFVPTEEAEEETPEIDAMAGIVSEAEKKPKSERSRKRKGGKNEG